MCRALRAIGRVLWWAAAIALAADFATRMDTLGWAALVVVAWRYAAPFGRWLGEYAAEWQDGRAAH